jgi:hypothetical protein
MKSHASKIKIYPQIITPELAGRYLEKNIGIQKGDDIKNRKFNDKNIQFLYNQMKNGEWMITGDPIKFSDTGKLIDGQHTLMAIKKLGKPIEMFIAEGLKEEVFTVLDTGKNRSASDVLSMKGYSYSTNLAGAIRSILLYQSGCYTDQSKHSRTSHATNTAVLKFVQKNPEITEVVSYIINDVYKNFRYLNTSALSMLYWVLSVNNQTKCDAFFEKYSTGIELSEGSPIRLLREKFLKDSVNKTKLSTRDKIALFIMAWNSFITNKKIHSLALPKNYDFPKAI